MSAAATYQQCVAQTRLSGPSASTHCGLEFTARGPSSFCLCAWGACGLVPGWAAWGVPFPTLSRVCIGTRGQFCPPFLPTSSAPGGLQGLICKSKAISNRGAGVGHWEEVGNARRWVRTVLEKPRWAQVWRLSRPECPGDTVRTFGGHLFSVSLAPSPLFTAGTQNCAT